MKIPTLRDEWISLAEVIFCGLESKEQYIETQKAFYAGATSVLHIMLKVAEKGVIETDGALVIESIRQEIIEFMKTIKK